MPSSGGAVYRILSGYTQRLARREAVEAAGMARRWRGIERTLEGQILKTIMAIQDRQKNGKAVGRTAITRLDAYKSLLRQVTEQAREYEAYATRSIAAEQLTFAEMGIRAAQEAIGQAGIAFNRINTGAVQNMVGMTADGSPLFDVLKKRALAPEMAAGMTDALVEAITLGYNPRKTAAMMADGLAQGLTKALTIARTEQIRAYRTASLQQYQEAGIVEYQRHAVPSERTCLACLALDGEIQQSSEVLASHPNCRCFVTPIIVGFNTPEGGSGEGWLAEQDEATQKKILGGRYEMWKDGTPLIDMVIIKDDPVWGPTIGIRAMAEM